MNNTTRGSVNPFGLVRSTIESELKAPGVLTITSAVDGDGKTGVAAGLIRSLASAGYRVLAVDATDRASDGLGARLDMGDPRPIPIAVAAKSLPGPSTTLATDVMKLALADEMPSVVSVAALYAAARSRYDYVVVDTGTVTGGGLSFVQNADAVVLAVREGRAIATEDREAVDLLNRLGVRFLGVVATTGRHATHGAPAAQPAATGFRGRFQQLFATKSPL